MNDFQMSFLANDHRNELLAEADRQRRSRHADAATERSRSTKTGRPRRPGRLSFLFGRAAA